MLGPVTASRSLSLTRNTRTVNTTITTVTQQCQLQLHQIQCRTFASKSTRNFYQELDEKYLSEQLSQISRVGQSYTKGDEVFEHEEEAEAEAKEKERLSSLKSFANRGSESLKDKAKTCETPSLALSGFDKNRTVDHNAGDFSHNFELDAKLNVAKPWEKFESFRTNVKDGTQPAYQDLTHAEAVQVQAAYKKKLMLERKVRWLKMNQVPNPAKEARLKMKEEVQKREELENDPDRIYPPPLTSTDVELNTNKRMVRMHDSSRMMEMESQARMKIRHFKLENARIMKQSPPDIAGQPNDPILRHIDRRRVRINALLHNHLEGFLTNNCSQIIHQFLEGASVSIIKVTSKNPKGIHDIHYQITRLPKGRTEAWVQNKMQTLAPKLRSQLALKVNLTHTPEIRFVPQAFSVPSQNRSRLFKIVKSIRAAKANGTLDSWTREMNWKSNSSDPS